MGILCLNGRSSLKNEHWGLIEPNISASGLTLREAAIPLILFEMHEEHWGEVIFS